jgi:hypothetical protein
VVSDALALASLLEVARERLREELAPCLDGEGRFTAAMVGNAMAIAARALRLGTVPAEAELEALRRLYPEEQRPDLDELRRRLVDDLEAGRLDGPVDRSVRAVLRARIDARLQVSNPGRRG